MKTSTLNHMQITACKLLLEGQDFNSVGLLVGRDQSTVRRWVTLPDFAEMLNAGKLAAFQEAGIRLAKTSYLAACTLEQVMVDPDTKDEHKIKAATEILNYALKLSDTLDLQNRIQLLENVAKVNVDE